MRRVVRRKRIGVARRLVSLRLFRFPRRLLLRGKCCCAWRKHKTGGGCDVLFGNQAASRKSRSDSRRPKRQYQCAHRLDTQRKAGLTNRTHYIFVHLHIGQTSSRSGDLLFIVWRAGNIAQPHLIQIEQKCETVQQCDRRMFVIQAFVKHDNAELRSTAAGKSIAFQHNFMRIEHAADARRGRH